MKSADNRKEGLSLLSIEEEKEKGHPRAKKGLRMIHKLKVGLPDGTLFGLAEVAGTYVSTFFDFFLRRLFSRPDRI